MPDLWLDVDTALSEVPVNVAALIDDTDFKTKEESVAYDATGMDLVWNFVTTAGAFTQTAVTPTTAGNYDWANQGNGMYSIEVPASGGASINNDTEGFGWFTGVATGILPWRGPIIGFRASALNNALTDGGDYLDVNLVEIAGGSVPTPAVTGVPDVNVTHWLDSAASALVTAAGVADAVWDEASTGHTDAGKAGAQLWTDLDSLVTNLVTALAEPAAVPAANATLAAKLNYLATFARNKLTQTATTQILYADDGSTPVATRTLSDNGTTFTSGEAS